ncbi:MAG TPA: hypothetical protein VKG84_13690 [Candidatus Acidoferrales bacterium]|nr:hypothetical protein [Candidatus Acidoferrales bacterium]
MPRILFGALCLAACLAAPAPAAPQGVVVVDRVLARIENEVITLSDARELAAYQRLAGRTPGTESDLLRELIDQWVVTHDAAAAHFAAPPAQQVDAEFTALRNQVGAPGQFAARLRELELSEQDVRKFVARQVFLDLYLDRKFRAVARVQPGEVEKYYDEEFVPQLKRRSQTVPPLDDVRDSITDVLTERDITRRAQQWIDQARTQLDIEIVPESRP